MRRLRPRPIGIRHAPLKRAGVTSGVALRDADHELSMPLHAPAEPSPPVSRTPGVAWFIGDAIVLLLIMLAVVLVSWYGPPRAYLVVHDALEAFVLVVCGMVFGVAWYSSERSWAQATLAATFACAGVFSFWHLAAQMDLRPPASNERIVFDQAARLAAAIGIAAVVCPVGMAAALLAALALIWAGEWAPQAMPRMTDAAGAPTSLRSALSVPALLFYGAALWGAYRRRREGPKFVLLLVACALAFAGELWFLMEQVAGRGLWLAGHACKAGAFYLVYRSLFVEPLREPQARVDDLQTRLSETHAQWQVALEAGHHGVFDTRLDGGATYRSNRYLAMLGYTREELPDDFEALVPLVHPQDRGLIEKMRLQASNSDYEPAEVEFRVRAKDGAYRWLLARAAVLQRDEAGRPLRVGGTVTDITERKRMEQELREATQRLRALAAREREIVEEDRKRIARSLHDDFGQYLMALRMELELLGAPQRSTEQRAESVARAHRMVEHLRDAMRRAVRDLRPAVLDDLGAAAAAETLVADFAKLRGVKTNVSTEGVLDDLPKPVGETLYRVLQEALNNVARHAGAREVHVRFERASDRVMMTVHDDGVGLSADARRKPGHFGLFGIEERVAHLHGHMDVQSSAHGGTTLAVTLPLGGDDAAGAREPLRG
jgi:PAS domain S-box-containing protein